jgi:hypothetical protein
MCSLFAVAPHHRQIASSNWHLPNKPERNQQPLFDSRGSPCRRGLSRNLVKPRRTPPGGAPEARFVGRSADHGFAATRAQRRLHLPAFERWLA